MGISPIFGPLIVNVEVLMEYLDFELPIKELEEQLDKCLLIGAESEVDVSETCKQIENKL